MCFVMKLYGVLSSWEAEMEKLDHVCSQKGEYVLLPHEYFYEILFIGCSKFRVEIRSVAGRNKMAFTCSVSASMCLAVGQSVLLYQRKIVSLVI